ncbi:MAG: nucleoside hydrolase [Proteobacteria bacterium]|nr:nucleoside hydrolase [Pseudomonadota bacterium]
MSARPIILDCDPGQDDAVAIMLALASPELGLIGITTVAGNVGLELTAANARRICELVGRADIKVYAGCEQPLRRRLVTATHIHGENGLRGLDLPPPRQAVEPIHAVDFIVETVRARPGITLCPIGPLTNIAAALAKAPDIAGRIREIVLMGGAMRGGNVTPVAEFNIYVDPEAAAIVFGCGAPIVMLGLDATHQALVTPARVAALRAAASRAAAAAARLNDFPERYDAERYGGPGLPLHDPCVIAYLLRPDLFGGRHCAVAIETVSELTRGQTVVDWRRRDGRPANALVIDRIDAEGLFALLTARLATL